MRNPLHGLVLAGGRSSRMGQDKAALVHPDGRPLARRCYDLLAAAGCQTVVLSLRADQAIPDGFSDLPALEIVRDPVAASHGPIAGIVAGMDLQTDADWLVVACDLPRLDSPTLAHLIASLRADEPFLAYRSEFDGLPEPLCTLYTSAALPILRQALADDFCCPRKILIRNDCRLLDPVTPHALDNANSPADWASAQRPIIPVQVHYFGLLAERRGLVQESVVTSALTAAELYRSLDLRHQLGLSTDHFRCAIHDAFVAWDQPLQENDVIALLPPMSGG